MPDFSGANFSDQEKPIGTVDGTNRVFTLANVPTKFSEEVFKDGMKMARASTLAMLDGDYYLDYPTATITFSESQIPQTKSVILVSYKYMRAV
jgi:hypothetical protein